MDEEELRWSESIEDVRRAWREGERGVTRGSKRLSPEDQARVDAAAYGFDTRDVDVSTITIRDNTFESGGD